MLRFQSLAKITSPGITSVYPRERLFDLLDQAMTKPSVWIKGPPGSGKTCLVSNYLHSRKLRNLWYQVDDGDADIATFFYYMRLAVPRVTPRRGTPLPLLTPEYLQGVLAFTRRYCQNLFKRLRSPFVLVFDNYQEVPEGSSFHEVIKSGIGELPKGANVIFISRSDPPPVLARLRANEIIETIGWNELRLTQDEAQGIMKLRVGKLQSVDQFIGLHEKTQGWVAGLILMLDHAQLEGVSLQNLNKFTPEEIFDYFAGEIFQKLDEPSKDFLLKTSFLPTMTIRMAEELTGNNLAGQILSLMNQKNNFTTRYIQPEPVYQFHPLFREFLIQHARLLMSSEEISETQYRAASLLENFGMIEDAIKLLRDSGITQELVTKILKWAPFLIENGRMQTLEEWLSSLPLPLFEEFPWLLYWLGLCRQPFEPRKSRKFIERAFSLFLARKDAVGAFMSWCEMGIAIQSDESGNHHELDPWISTLDQLMNEFPQFPTPEIHDRVATVMFIALMMRMPQHSMMEAVEKRALVVFQSSTKPKIQAEIGVYLALYHLLSGEFSKAEVEVSTLHGLAQAREAPPMVLVLGRLADALYDWRVGRFDECLQIVSEGLKIANNTGVHLWDFLLLAQGLSASLSMGNFDKAQEFREMMAPDFDGRRRLVVSYYRFLASWEAYLQNNDVAALQHAETSLQAAIETGVPYFEASSHLALANILYRLDETEYAAKHLELALDISISIKSYILEFTCLITKAAIAMDQKDDNATNAALRTALAIGKDKDYVYFSWCLPETLSRLCARALHLDIEIEYVKKLIKKRGLIPETTFASMYKWPWEIKVFTLGRFDIHKQGSRLSFTRKAQKKPLELLKLVLTCGGKNVPEEKISGTLWPDAEGDSAHQSFTSALHRLRKLLGNDQCIHLLDGKLSLDPRHFWVDYWVFERLLDDVVDTDKTRIMSEFECIQRIQNTVSLYQGAFLPGDTEVSWSMTMRDHLRSRFINYISKLGQGLEQAKDWNAASELYKKGLEADNLVEEFYRNLMRCYLHLNLKTEGLAVYHRCKTLFSVVLGSKPSAATEAVHNLLMNLT